MKDSPPPTGASPHPDRVVHLHRMFNVRDLGGLPTTDGGRVRSGLLFRADDGHFSTDADRTTLAALGLASSIDLRVESEVGHRGVRLWDELGVRRHSRPLWSRLPSDAHDFKYHDPRLTGELYADMLQKSRAEQAALWTALVEATRDGPTVIHCASGRDRTGILVALVLSLLDVPEEAILEDYAMSATGMARMLAHLEATHQPEDLVALNLDAEAMVLTPPAAIGAFLATIRNDFGSVEGYAASIGVADLVPDLRSRLLSD